jgi:DNA-binding beta-propeller fold protein YncE
LTAPRRNRSAPRLLAAALLPLLLAACGTPQGVVFEPLKNPPRWPDPPEPARIVYLGQLATSADLKPARLGIQVLGDKLFGAAVSYSMLTPFSACTDGADRVFVADATAQLIHVFDLHTRRYQQWHPQADGQHFSQPVAVAWDPDGKLIVSDSIGGVLWVLDTHGQVLAKLGEGTLQRPCGIAIAPATHRIYVADSQAHQVVVLSAQGQVLARIGRRGEGPGEFNFPTAVALDSHDRLYVCDALNFRVQQFDPRFVPLRTIGHQGDMPGCFAQPKALAVDHDDHLYVLDAQFEAVEVFDPEGRLLLSFGEEGRQPGRFWLPTGISIDARNRIWIGDSYNRRIQVFEYLSESESWTTRPAAAPPPAP